MDHPPIDPLTDPQHLPERTRAEAPNQCNQNDRRPAEKAKARVRRLEAQLESERAEHIAQDNRIKDLERLLRAREDSIDQLAHDVCRQAEAYRKLKCSGKEELDRIAALHRDQLSAAGRALATVQLARESLEAQVSKLNEQLRSARVEKVQALLERDRSLRRGGRAADVPDYVPDYD